MKPLIFKYNVIKYHCSVRPNLEKKFLENKIT